VHQLGRHLAKQAGPGALQLVPTGDDEAPPGLPLGQAVGAGPQVAEKLPERLQRVDAIDAHAPGPVPLRRWGRRGLARGRTTRPRARPAGTAR
jgi:hypothetical protein